MTFQIHALPIEPFAADADLPDGALRERGIRRVVADGKPHYPCRVSLQDAVAGERLLLLPYLHHDVETPYRASGPIYVREAAARATPAVGDVPARPRSRLLLLRAYDARGVMSFAEVLAGTELEAGIAQLFETERVAYLQVPYVEPGCDASRVERA